MRTSRADHGHRAPGWHAVGAAGLGVAALIGALALIPAAPSLAASPPDTVDTGDPPPPADPTVPEGLDEALPPPDDSIVEMPPPALPGIVPNANTVKIAWVGTPAQRPDDDSLVTLQAALNAAPLGATVSFDPNDYAFTGALLVPRAVTIDTSAASILYARFTVNGGGLALADDITIGAANTGAVITVAVSDAVLTGVTIRNPTPVLRPTGIQLAAGITGVRIDRLDMDGAGHASSYGINLTTGSATITDPAIVGVATGVTAAAASTAAGIAVSDGTISASTAGVSLGGATTPSVSGLEVSGVAGAGTGVDLATSRGAVVDAVTVHGFTRGIGAATTNAGAGPVITGAVIDGSSREGIALGATTAPHVVGATITGTGASQSTGILLLRSTGAVIEQPTISGVMYGITTHADNTGAGPAITAPRVTAFGGITLGSTQGAVITGAVLDSGPWAGGTGINVVNAGRVTITDETATGFLYAVGSQSTVDPISDRVDISISNIDVVGAVNASHGVYLLGAVDATIADVTADITGAALVIHQSVGVRARNVTVHGHQGPTSTTGAAILRAYGSQNVNVDVASIDSGSYGFFYSDTDGSTITHATVAGLVEYALYGRSVRNLDVSASTLSGNSAVGLLVVTTPANGISHDIKVHDNTMTGNDGGIQVLQGTTGVQITGNTISGQPTAVIAGPAHDLLISGNAIDQAGADGFAAITVAPLWEDGALSGSYSSSGIRVTGNTFTGGGTWLRVGTIDDTAAEASHRTLRDPILVTGNHFPAASTAIRTYPNAVVGEDTAPAADGAAVTAKAPAKHVPAAGILPLVAAAGGPVAVDARDYATPNDWGAPCKATGFLDGAPYYAGGGADVRELTVAPVLYPMNCIDLSLTEALKSPGEIHGTGSMVSWTLTPHNDGPRAAPAGWGITQLLPDGAELVSMTGPGYQVNGTTATATGEIAAGADGPALTVTVRLVSPPPGDSTMRDVAYISPAAETDLDGDGYVDVVQEQFRPLVVPTLATDTDASATDNDAQGSWATSTDAGGTQPADAAGLPGTGSDIMPPLIIGAVLLVVGYGVRQVARRRHA